MRASGRIAALLLGFVIGFVALPARADDDDEDAIGRALAAGEVQPLQPLLERIRAEFPGDVLTVELEHEDDRGRRWVYEVKLLTPTGDVLRLDYDAGTLELLSIKGRHRGRRGDD